MAEHRYEREIDELLKRLDAEHRDPLPFRMRRRTSRWGASWRRLHSLLGVQSAVERLMALSAALLLAAFLLGFFAPSRLAWPLALLAVVCFVASIGLSVWQGTSSEGAQRHWRGQPYPPAGQAVDWHAIRWQLRRWLKRFRR